MSFYLFNKIESDFNLKLSDKALWDLVRSGKLQPFIERIGFCENEFLDPKSNDPLIKALFPNQDLYDHFLWLKADIERIRKDISKTPEEAWEEHLDWCDAILA
jgi:hypothetical protein